MAKKVMTLIKLQVPGGQANPAPPVGPALGQHGVNIMDFCKAFNAQTQQDNGTTIPVEITVYEARSFTFIPKTPPAAVLIKQAINLQKGSGVPHLEKAGKVEYRTDRNAIVHLSIGKASFTAEDLLENYATLIEEIMRAKPSQAKGKYIKTITLTTTMGPGIRVDTSKTSDIVAEEALAA